MTGPSPLWVWTPTFARAGATQQAGPAERDRLMHYDPEHPREALLAFRDMGRTSGVTAVIIFDLARFPDETAWAYVRDGINRSGSHPLRGLAPLMREPFVDLTQLYHVPAGETGVVADCLGARYPGGPSERAVCGHLHDAAILAHSEGLRVTGVLVSEAQRPEFVFPPAAPS